MNLTGIPAGAIALARIPGALGWAIGQGMAGIAHDASRWTHVGVVTAPYVNDQHPGGLVEAMPGKAREVTVRYFARHERPALFMWRPDMSPDQQYQIVTYAIDHSDIPYSYVSYLAQALGSRRPQWLTDRLLHSPGQICSALADAAYLSAGIHLFAGKQPWDVSPGDYQTLPEANDDAWTVARFGKEDR